VDRKRLRAVAIATIVAMIAFVAVSLRELLVTVRPAPVAPQPASVARLTDRLVFVVIDGLRHDLAIDPARAPNLARHMRDDAHAVVWAGRVTMTSAAVLSWGTGQRASFAQVILNFNMGRTTHNDLFANARAAGIRTALAGDDTWPLVYGPFDRQILDRQGMAIEEDNSREIFAAAQTLANERPNVLVAHFLAPDHQGHAYGVQSDRYRAFLLRFDEDLERFVAALPTDTTLVVMSDHGALDNGNHGVDSLTERKTFLYARGPGIRRGVDLGAIDQVDVSATLAVLLGVPGASQGRGTAVTELLDVSAQDTATIACSDAERIVRVATAEKKLDRLGNAKSALETCANASLAPEIRRDAGRAVVRAWDRLLDVRSVRTNTLTVALVMGIFLVFAGFVSRNPLLVVLALAICTVTAIAGTWIENESPRRIFLAAAHVPLVLALLLPSRVAAQFEKRPLIGFAIVPVVLACTFPWETRNWSLVSLALVAALWIFAPHADVRSHRVRVLGWPRVSLACAGFAAMVPYAFGAEDPILSLPGSPLRLALFTHGAIAAWLVLGARSREARGTIVDVLFAIVIACGSVLLRRSMPSTVGLFAIVALPLLAVTAASRGRNTLACGLGFASYGLISRPEEVLAVIGALIVIEAIAASTEQSASLDDPPFHRRPFAIATLTLGLVAASYLVRIGVQRGLDFPTIDWGAGKFDEPAPGQLRLALVIAWKFVAPFLLLVWLLVRGLSPEMRRGVLVSSSIVLVLRGATMTLTLFLARSSFWTSYRMLSDLPSIWLMACGLAVALLLTTMTTRARFLRSGQPQLVPSAGGGEHS